ncbi:hypothetical protein ED733_001846 [Metarhizium rileyi]|uniref:Uncharacterized protein n=1 Tax=Metarhizium rileyi (strain RCEF 4871) TaxID=1649241 RepID=A0A5C6G1L5_METRR|nr:hypothetical protein ED733_001846 [Metarhizium rileyi]
MYPDWPDSAADLVPLPQCIGPKLNPFDFHGPQKIIFREYIGEGRHSFVFKVEIHGNMYALKLVSKELLSAFTCIIMNKTLTPWQFRFDYVRDWIGIADEFDEKDITAAATMYNYSEPFSCECRSFGRLQESGCEDLAVKCFGYILLDEEHERAMRDKFADIDLEFDGNVDCPGYWPMRSLYPGKSGRPPPIRGIVKELGSQAETLNMKVLRRYLDDIKRFQQLGIIQLDVAERQFIGGKICDFSTAVTLPHIMTNSELSPHLPSAIQPYMEYQTFLLSISDYWSYDVMIQDWHHDHEPKTEILARAFPSRNGCNIKYDLRKTPSRNRVYTFVDPRKYDWKKFTASVETDAGALPQGDPRTRLGKRKRSQTSNGNRVVISKTRPRFDKRPPRWYYRCGERMTAFLKEKAEYSSHLQWFSKDGLVFPRRGDYAWNEGRWS